mmetsp:Transcript_6410/g.7780  ORF Transcript_6410/g.7780 Transcript_6410/m.7780 type:complete len:401 (-) Transcript_6410:3154-4356(-)
MISLSSVCVRFWLRGHRRKTSVGLAKFRTSCSNYSFSNSMATGQKEGNIKDGCDISPSSQPSRSEQEYILALEKEIKRLKNKVEIESKGRINAEKALRSRFLENTNSIGYIRPIGKVSSCFPQRFGTPRQGLLAPNTRGSIQLDPSVVGVKSFDGLEGFSHVWVIFVFHENTNMHRFAKNPQKPEVDCVFPSFVKPPQGGGMRVGLFATRTPHRPNPIGLSLVMVEKVDMNSGTLHIHGLDLVDGTPILDIKPYLPHIDNPMEVNEENGIDECVHMPRWVQNKKFELAPVEFSSEALESLDLLTNVPGKLKWYFPGDIEELKSAITQIIRLDPRAVIHGRGAYNKKGLNTLKKENYKESLIKSDNLRQNFHLRFDNLKIGFSPCVKGERALTVHTIEEAN